MNGARALLMIVQRESEQEYIQLLGKSEVTAVFSMPGQGTAGQNVLSLLGLDATEKTVLLCVTGRQNAARLMREMVTDMGINLPGCGIALSIPISSIGGASVVKLLLGEEKDEKNEVDVMEGKRTYPYELIIAIAQRGNADLVMAAARTAGAGGGTIVHAKGTATDSAAKFFGISIADEKELILIATRHDKKDAIMHAIMEKAGARTDAHAVVFTVPVDDVAGLRSVMEETPHGNP